jgi:hypothetical protein
VRGNACVVDHADRDAQSTILTLTLCIVFVMFCLLYSVIELFCILVVFYFSMYFRMLLYSATATKET